MMLSRRLFLASGAVALLGAAPTIITRPGAELMRIVVPRRDIILPAAAQVPIREARQLWCRVSASFGGPVTYSVNVQYSDGTIEEHKLPPGEDSIFLDGLTFRIPR